MIIEKFDETLEELLLEVLKLSLDLDFQAKQIIEISKDLL